MCGIWALLSDNKIDRQYVTSKLPLFETIKNRGPDKTTLLCQSNSVYGFQRLAIHDISPLGDQPFTYQYYNENLDCNINCTLMVNGEIYNFREIIIDHELTDFKSHSDCEVIMHLWEKYESINKILQIIKGEFAFILNIEYMQNKLNCAYNERYICRDPFGIRPLFYNYDIDNNDNKIIIIGSTLTSVGKNGTVFPPGHYTNFTEVNKLKFTPYYHYVKSNRNYINDIDAIYKLITDTFIEAVRRRLSSDRPIGITLSGGLDSSIVAAICVKILKVENLHTFSTGLHDSVDLYYASICAKHLNTIHKVSPHTKEYALSKIKDAILMLETFDITTIRASIWQILVAEDIALSDIKVILNGDGADEVMMGYKENYFAPTGKAGYINVTSRLQNIHKYDGLRMDRCISSHGLEARPPFLDVDFVNAFRTINPELVRPLQGERMEKDLLRQAFNTLYPGILPDEILFRPKEAFSDGVSVKDSDQSWYQIIQEHIETIITDEEYRDRDEEFKSCFSKEAFYYKKIFYENFGNNYDVIKDYWLPNWSNTIEPSARTLTI
jgi:asparagine synthase (glutamine-hydrolysing)